MKQQATVQVVARLRPLNNREKQAGTIPVVTTSSERAEVTLIKGTGVKAAKHTFKFSKVFGSFDSQEEVFSHTLAPIIQDVCDGIESTVFAYGQTGTGKTYTMEGQINSDEHKGIIPRSADVIFSYLSDPKFIQSQVNVSYLEIYNEELSDLLLVGDSANKLLIAPDNNKRIKCHGLSVHKVESPKEVVQALKRAEEKKQVAQTKMNKSSSRSHCLFTIEVKSTEQLVEPDGRNGGTIERMGKLHLVDLAGSESAKAIEDGKGKRSRRMESTNINQSLLTLGRVITALKEKQKRIPYRDCKLTRLLQEALGGHSKTCIIATLSPSVLCMDETHSTLNFAERAHGLKNKITNASVRMSIPTPNTPTKGSVNCSVSADINTNHQTFRDMELRLAYMEAQCNEAQSALARKHLIAKEATEKAEEAKKLYDELEVKYKVTNENLEKALVKEQRLEESLRAETLERMKKEVVLEATRNTERQLQDEGQILLSKLQESIGYSENLHSLLMTSVDEAKNHSLRSKELQQAAHAQIAMAVGQNSQLEVDLKENLFKKLSSFLDTMKQDIQTANNTLISRSSERHHLVDKNVDALNNTVQSNIDYNLENTQKIVETHKLADKQLRDDMSMCTKSFQENFESLLQFVNSQEKNLEDYFKQRKDTNIEFLASSKRANTDHSGFIQSIQNDISKCVNNQVEELNNQKTTMETMLESLEGILQQNQQHLLILDSYLSTSRNGIDKLRTDVSASFDEIKCAMAEDNCFKIAPKTKAALEKLSDKANKDFDQEKKTLLGYHENLVDMLRQCKEGNLFCSHSSLINSFKEKTEENIGDKFKLIGIQQGRLDEANGLISTKAVELSNQHTKLLEQHRKDLTLSEQEGNVWLSEQNDIVKKSLEDHKKHTTDEKILKTLDSSLSRVRNNKEVQDNILKQQESQVDAIVEYFTKAQAAVAAEVVKTVQDTLVEKLTALDLKLKGSLKEVVEKNNSVRDETHRFRADMETSYGELFDQRTEWSASSARLGSSFEALEENLQSMAKQTSCSYSQHKQSLETISEQKNKWSSNNELVAEQVDLLLDGTSDIRTVISQHKKDEDEIVAKISTVATEWNENIQAYASDMHVLDEKLVQTCDVVSTSNDILNENMDSVKSSVDTWTASASKVFKHLETLEKQNRKSDSDMDKLSTSLSDQNAIAVANASEIKSALEDKVQTKLNDTVGVNTVANKIVSDLNLSTQKSLEDLSVHGQGIYSNVSEYLDAETSALAQCSEQRTKRSASEMPQLSDNLEAVVSVLQNQVSKQLEDRDQYRMSIETENGKQSELHKEAVEGHLNELVRNSMKASEVLEKFVKGSFEDMSEKVDNKAKDEILSQGEKTITKHSQSQKETVDQVTVLVQGHAEYMDEFAIKSETDLVQNFEKKVIRFSNVLSTTESESVLTKDVKLPSDASSQLNVEENTNESSQKEQTQQETVEDVDTENIVPNKRHKIQENLKPGKRKESPTAQKNNSSKSKKSKKRLSEQDKAKPKVSFIPKLSM